MQNTTTADVTHIKFPKHVRGDGALTVMQGNGAVPFAIARIFIVHGAEGSIRGHHAHKECQQLLIALNGEIEVRYTDGKDKASVTLRDSEQGLLIPPGIWAVQEYKTAGAILAVLCDRPYEADDYILDQGAFETYKAL